MFWYNYGIFFIIGWLILIILYNNWLIAKRGITAMRLGRILAAALDFFMWGTIIHAEQFSVVLLMFIVIAALILLMIFAVNFSECQSIFHAIMMTLFQFTGGFMVFWMICGVSNSRKKKKQD